LKDAGVLEFNQVETKVTKTLLEFIEAINKILRDSESERSTDKMEILVREVLKLQNTFISLNSQD
jgi:polyhydroxyalkanoate synthesis regulator phasin